MPVGLTDNLGVRSRKIAYDNNIPISTVEKIIKDYHKSLSNDLVDKGRLTITGIVTITAVKGVDGIFVPNSRSSSTLKERLREKEFSN